MNKKEEERNDERNDSITFNPTKKIAFQDKNNPQHKFFFPPKVILFYFSI